MLDQQVASASEPRELVLPELRLVVSAVQQVLELAHVEAQWACIAASLLVSVEKPPVVLAMAAMAQMKASKAVSGKAVSWGSLVAYAEQLMDYSVQAKEQEDRPMDSKILISARHQSLFFMCSEDLDL